MKHHYFDSAKKGQKFVIVCNNKIIDRGKISLFNNLWSYLLDNEILKK